MDNVEFCNLLKEAKRMSGKTNVDIIVALKKSQGTLSDMLNGRADYTLSKYLPYINAIGFQLALNKGDNVLTMYDISDVHQWLQNETSGNSLSYSELGNKLGVSSKTAMRIVKGGALRLSVFLKCAEIFGWSITLDAI